MHVYENIDTNQVFSTKESINILKCSPFTSRVIRIKLREMKVVCEVKGIGKGKYRLVNQDDKKKISWGNDFFPIANFLFPKYIK